VIPEVGFDRAMREVLRVDREASGQGMYTFEPVEFPIIKLDRW
jgi:hypothetical protein